MLNSLHSDIRDAPRKTPSVLLVDDEQPMLRTLRRMIQPEGYDVRDACDAATFSTELEGQPEVILLDLQLGDLSGVELMREVREASPDSEVIMMTGYATIDSVVESMRAGAFDYLEKPFSDAHRVVRTLERALERRNSKVNSACAPRSTASSCNRARCAASCRRSSTCLATRVRC